MLNHFGAIMGRSLARRCPAIMSGQMQAVVLTRGISAGIALSASSPLTNATHASCGSSGAPPAPPWHASGSMGKQRRLLAQVLIVDSGERILLARHTAKGLLPGLITGLIVEGLPGETAASAAMRAAREVADVDLGSEDVLELRAILDFHEAHCPDDVFEEYEFVVRVEKLHAAHEQSSNVHLASIPSANGEKTPSKPGLVPEFDAPMWYQVGQIPYGQMPADDRVWYPAILRGTPRKLLGRFWVDGPDLMQHEMWWES